jgi:beta-alanine degradation protein BauB
LAIEPTEQVGTRLMFENERVRVWDLALAPGEQLETHVHRHAYLYVTIAPGLIRFADPDDPSRYQDYHFREDEVGFYDREPGGKVDPRLINVGPNDHRNLVIELKR